MKVFHDFIFPTHIVISQNEDFDDYKKDLLNYVNTLENIHVETSPGPGSEDSWRSQCMFHEDPLFSFYKDRFLSQIDNTVKQFGLSQELYIDGSWVVRNKPGSYLKTHVHSGCVLSGVLWLSVPENSGNLTFLNTNSWMSSDLFDTSSEHFRQTYNMYSNYSYQPLEGKMVIFPAYLPHSVEQNRSSEDRISITFNLSKYK